MDRAKRVVAALRMEVWRLRPALVLPTVPSFMWLEGSLRHEGEMSSLHMIAPRGLLVYSVFLKAGKGVLAEAQG
jgi:hypothetical protein